MLTPQHINKHLSMSVYRISLLLCITLFTTTGHAQTNSGEDFVLNEQRYTFDKGLDILVLNGTRLVADAYTVSSVDGSLNGAVSIDLHPGQLFDKIEGTLKNGQLYGAIKIHRTLDPMLKVRPILYCPPSPEKICPTSFCAPDIADCIELETPRLTYFQGVAKDGKLTGSLLFWHIKNLIADIKLGDEGATFDEASVFLYNPDSLVIPTRHFFGRITTSWELVGTWEDLPWQEIFADFSVDVMGNQAVAVNSQGYVIAGPFGGPSPNMTGYKLIENDMFNNSYLDERYRVDRDYTDSVMGSFKVSESSVGMFHDKVVARTNDGIVYEGRFSPSSGLIVGDIVVIGDKGQRYSGWIKDGQIFWETPTEKKSVFGKIGRELQRVWDKDIEANIRRGRRGFCDFIDKKKENCYFNFGVSVNADGKITIINNQGYVAPKDEKEVIRNLTTQQLAQMQNEFTNSLYGDHTKALGLSYIMEARMYGFLSQSSRLNPAGSIFFLDKMKAQKKDINELIINTNLSANLIFDDVDFQNRRLQMLGKIYRTPAGVVDTFSSIFGFFQAADMFSKLYDDSDRLRDMSKRSNLTSEQRRLIYKAELKFMNLQSSQLSVQLTGAGIELYQAMMTLPFQGIDDLPKERKIKLLMKSVDNINDAKEFLQNYPKIKSENDYYLKMSEFIRKKLAEELTKNDKSGYDFSLL